MNDEFLETQQKNSLYDTTSNISGFERGSQDFELQAWFKQPDDNQYNKLNQSATVSAAQQISIQDQLNKSNSSNKGLGVKEYKKIDGASTGLIGIFSNKNSIESSKNNDSISGIGQGIKEQRKTANALKPLNSEDNPYKEIQNQQRSKDRDNTSSLKRDSAQSSGFKYNNVFQRKSNKKGVRGDSEQASGTDLSQNGSSSQQQKSGQTQLNFQNLAKDTQQRQSQPFDPWRALGSAIAGAGSSRDQRSSAQKNSVPFQQDSKQQNQSEGQQSSESQQNPTMTAKKNENSEQNEISPKFSTPNDHFQETPGNTSMLPVDLIDELFSGDSKDVSLDNIPVSHLQASSNNNIYTIKEPQSKQLQQKAFALPLNNMKIITEEDVEEQSKHTPGGKGHRDTFGPSDKQNSNKSQNVFYNAQGSPDQISQIGGNQNNLTTDPSPDGKNVAQELFRQLFNNDLPPPQSEAEHLMRKSVISIPNQNMTPRRTDNSAQQQQNQSLQSQIQNSLFLSLQEFRADKKVSPREQKLMQDIRASPRGNTQLGDQMILIYLEEDFLEESMKKMLFRIIDDIDEDLKQMKVFLNDFLRPLIKQGCRSIAQQAIEEAQGMNLYSDFLFGRIYTPFVNKESMKIFEECQQFKIQEADATKEVTQSLVINLQDDLLGELLLRIFQEDFAIKQVSDDMIQAIFEDELVDVVAQSIQEEQVHSARQNQVILLDAQLVSENFINQNINEIIVEIITESYQEEQERQQHLNNEFEWVLEEDSDEVLKKLMKQETDIIISEIIMEAFEEEKQRDEEINTQIEAINEVSLIQQDNILEEVIIQEIQNLTFECQNQEKQRKELTAHQLNKEFEDYMMRLVTRITDEEGGQLISEVLEEEHLRSMEQDEQLQYEKISLEKHACDYVTISAIKSLMPQLMQESIEEEKKNELIRLKQAEQQKFQILKLLIQSIVLPGIDNNIKRIVSETLQDQIQDQQARDFQVMKVVSFNIVQPVVEEEIVKIITSVYEDFNQDQLNAKNYLNDLKLKIGNKLLEEQQDKLRKQEDERKRLTVRMSERSQSRENLGLGIFDKSKKENQIFKIRQRNQSNAYSQSSQQYFTDQLKNQKDQQNDSMDSKGLFSELDKNLKNGHGEIEQDDGNIDLSEDDEEDQNEDMRQELTDRQVIPHQPLPRDAYEVMEFQHNMSMAIDVDDQTPFIQLIANPEYIDVLCVNCYECVRFEEVNLHSQVCLGLQQQEEEEQHDDIYNLDLRKSLNKLVQPKEENEEDFNERIYKLIKAVKNRLVEMQLEDRSNPMADHYSNLHAIAVKIFQNNSVFQLFDVLLNYLQDANSLLIMQKIIEDFISDLKEIQKTQLIVTEREVSLFVFSRRLILLNNEKYNQLDNFQDYQYIEYQVPGYERRKSQIFLQDVKSEINSDHYVESQSQFSDFSGVSGFSKHFKAGQQFQAADNNSQYQSSPLRGRSPITGKKGGPSAQHTPNYLSNFDADEQREDRIRAQTLGNPNVNYQQSPINQRNNNLDQSPLRSNARYGAQTQTNYNQRRNNNDDQYEQQMQQDEGELRKRFFQMVIEQMNKLSGRLPPGMTFASLYRDAQVANIDINQWEKFIFVKLKNAENSQQQQNNSKPSSRQSRRQQY